MSMISSPNSKNTELLKIILTRWRLAAKSPNVKPFLLQQTGGAHTVLRVIVEHMVYPVTLDVIHQIFSRVGKVIKIVTFTKNNTFQVGNH